MKEMSAIEPTVRLEKTAARVVAGVGAVGAVGGGLFVWYFDPVSSDLFPACPLYSMTGFACPGCGMTRGLHSLLHGDVLEALDYNAMLPILMLFFGYLWFSMVLFAVRGRGLTPGKMSIAVIWVMLVLLLVFGILRNLPFYPFNILFP